MVSFMVYTWCLCSSLTKHLNENLFTDVVGQLIALKYRVFIKFMNILQEVLMYIHDMHVSTTW